MERLSKERAKFTILLFAVFMSSFGVLSFEVSLTRIFSVMFSYHYTFLVVSLALFGLGLGGIFAQSFSSKMPIEKTFSRLSVLSTVFSFSVSLFAFIAISISISNIAVAAFIMFLPFLVAGTLLAAIYKLFIIHSNVVYFADLLGAAVGAMAIVIILNLAGAVLSILLVSGLISIAALVFALASKKRTITVAAVASMTLVALFAQYSTYTTPWNISPADDQEKELTNALSDPTLGAKIVDSRWSAFGRTDLVELAADPHRKLIFVDGGAGTSLFHFDGDANSSMGAVSALRNSTQYFPYVLADKGNSLVIGPGGGLDVLTAIMAGVNHTTAVEVNPEIVSIVRDYEDYTGGIYTNYDNVHVNVDEGRSFIRRDNGKYDVIMLDIPVTKTPQGAAGYALAENYLFTTDAFRDYLNHLNDGGFLAIVAHGPAEVYKLTSITFKVLGAQGLSAPEIMDRISIVGVMGQHVHAGLPIFMLKKTPITNQQSMLIYEKTNELALPLAYAPNLHLSSFDPVLMALAHEEVTIDQLTSEARFDMTAPADDNPFFYKFDLGIPNTLMLLLAGAIVLSGAVSFFYVSSRRRREVLFTNGTMKVLKSKFSLFRLFCFASLGLGFMLLEVALIQKFILFLGPPTLAIATSLFALLFAGGLGSAISTKWRSSKHVDPFRVALFISVMVILYLVMLPYVFDVFLGYSTIFRILISFALIFPLAFLMGIPFPTILRRVKNEFENDAASMWCINGAFSVLGGALAIVFAMSLGFNAVLLSGAVTYLGVFLVGRTRSER